MQKKKFNHLSVFDRTTIEYKFKEGWSISRISKEFGRNRSSVSREIQRGKKIKYKAESAHTRALEKRKSRGKRNLLKNEFVKDYVEIAMKELDWSPEQISLRLAIDIPFEISHEAIYQYIYSK